MEKKLCCIIAYAFLTTIIFHELPCLAKIAMSLSTDQTALLSLKQHITSDPFAIVSRNWTNSSSVCSWIGVTCSSRHHRVAALNLSHMSLSGTIPPQLGHLSFLVSLDLTSNLFSGAIPQELSLLHRLKLMILRLNNFTGSIPKSLSNLTNLQVLELSFNSLSGELPKELGRLQNLQALSIQANNLLGEIPSKIFNMSKLGILALTSNELSGSLPTDMCSNLPFLAGIYLSENELSGGIPTNISQCSRLGVLDLSSNSFSGQIPLEIGYLASLQGLHLSRNRLNGTLPHEIGNLQNLAYFGVGSNQIWGSFPLNIFMNMSSSLQHLHIWRNKFTGSLSRDVGNLTMLTTFDLSENYFTGIIPSELGQLHQLKDLQSSLNNLIGSIPPELFNISTLENISIVFNDLSGVLPTNLCHASPNLKELYLGSNSISGPIPNSISNCSQLTLISLYENKLSGHIPTVIGNLRFLQQLHLFSNNFTDEPSSSPLSFITSLSNCKSLTGLSISDNPLYGVIPPSIGNLSLSLQYFYASHCQFSGSIPAEIGNLSSLVLLSLFLNKLSGNIPISIKHLHKLQGLNLQANMLQGPIPEAICDLYNLYSILLSHNKFSHPIPTCLGNVSSLREIFLNSNMLNATIPSSLWGLKDVIALVMFSNSLSGVLPQEIGNLGAAAYIDLSMNKLSGSIPITIGELQELGVLSLANNKLEGSIPVSIGHMINLADLDLSQNNLSGSIPKSLEALRHLEYFNVSFNTLSGEIPSGGSFRNFTMDSFEGNAALCGHPRFHVRICPAASTTHKSKWKRVKPATFIAFGVAAFISIVSLALIIFVRYKRKDETSEEVDVGIPIMSERISYYELLQATDQFSERNLLGTGSSCSVYKGILNSGKVVAVKVFNMQLEGISTKFSVECEILGGIRHRCLTSVISCCSNDEFKAIVLEYMPNGSLEKWLHSDNHCLNFTERLNIMIDVASALEYLHHGYSTPIVHSDLKPSNVLLDEDMVAHVSDFGIAKLLGNEDSMVLTETLATLGYIAPEYGLEGLVSTRCDVYSYGVMLIETFTKKRPSDDMFGGDLSFKRWIELSLPFTLDEVIDVNLLKDFQGEIYKIVQCVSAIFELALKCCVESAGDRINMREAHTELQKIKRRFLL